MTGLTWPLPDQHERRRSSNAGSTASGSSTQAQPASGCRTGPRCRRELRHKHVTLRLLWEEYKAQFTRTATSTAGSASASGSWRKEIDVVMRQEHKLGEKVFLDWAGDTIPLIDPQTGEIRPCYLFVAVLGASNYTYAEPSLSQDLRGLSLAHVRMFEFFGGVSGAPCARQPEDRGDQAPRYYEPDLNPAYTALAEHYGCCVLPTRPHRPRDKAKVETGVLIAERRIIARSAGTAPSSAWPR